MSKITDRTKFLGGSDAAAVLGVSEWRTPLQVYYQKTGTALPKELEPDPDQLRRFRRGKLMEPVVVRMVMDELPIKVVRRSSQASPNRYVHPNIPYLAAEVDFEWKVTPEIVEHFARNEVEIDPALIGTIQNGEVKTAYPMVAMRKFGDEGTDEIPIEYATQAHHGMLVTGRQLCMMPLLVGSDQLVIYWIKRDDALLYEMTKRLLRFWNENVLARVPPEPVNVPDVVSLFRRSGETRREATPEVEDLIKQYDAAKALVKDAEQKIDDIQFKLGTFLLGAELTDPSPDIEGRHVIVKDGKPLMTVAMQSQYRVSETQIKVKYPRVAEECVRLSQFFTYTRNKPRK